MSQTRIGPAASVRTFSMARGTSPLRVRPVRAEGRGAGVASRQLVQLLGQLPQPPLDLGVGVPSHETHFAVCFAGIYFPGMRTSAPAVLPLFRSEMQIRMLALLLLQPERSWTLQELAQALDSPASSVHRELGRAEAAGIIRRNSTARPHQFQAATDDPLYEPLASLLRRSVGVEEQLRTALENPHVQVALIYGSWAGETRRPDSNVDVLVVGDADLRELRRRVRPIGKAAGRTIDLTVLTADKYRGLLAERSSFVRRVLEAPITQLVGDLANIAQP